MIREMWHLTFIIAIIVPGPVQYARSLLQLKLCVHASCQHYSEQLFVSRGSSNFGCTQLILQLHKCVVEQRAEPTKEVKKFPTKSTCPKSTTQCYDAPSVGSAYLRE